MTGKLVHATCVALAPADPPSGTGRGGAFCVLLRGASGAGKSDLALRLIDRGWRLVADDQTELRAAEGRLLATAPATIAGRMEVRGLGILAVPNVPRAELCLVVDLTGPGAVERLPEPGVCELLGTAVQRMALDPFEASAPAKLRLAAGRAASAIMAGTGPGDEDRMGRRRADKRNMPDDVKAAKDGGHIASERSQRVVLVTGLSGAGRSTALDILEDLGYEAIDNPPLEFLPSIVGKADARRIAVGVDIRTRDFAVEPFLEQLDKLQADPALAAKLLFIDCDDEVLRRRYTETRRRHPLAQGRPLKDGVRAERRLVSSLRGRADLVIDTTSLTPGELRQILTGHLGTEDGVGMAVFITSFAYRHGLPRAADLVFDVRFLANPHYESTLRHLTGRDPEVAAFVSADPDFQCFLTQVTAMLRPLLPRYEREGKSYLTVALGCTGGRHRSVMVAERLAGWLRDEGYRVTLVHRDLAPEPDRP